MLPPPPCAKGTELLLKKSSEPLLLLSLLLSVPGFFGGSWQIVVPGFQGSISVVIN